MVFLKKIQKYTSIFCCLFDEPINLNFLAQGWTENALKKKEALTTVEIYLHGMFIAKIFTIVVRNF